MYNFIEWKQKDQFSIYILKDIELISIVLLECQTECNYTYILQAHHHWRNLIIDRLHYIDLHSKLQIVESQSRKKALQPL